MTSFVHGRISKHIKDPGKASLCTRLYFGLEEWYQQKEKMALIRGQEPWASLTRMNKILGLRDNISNRYMIMRFKKTLRKSNLIHFIRMFKAGELLADIMVFLCNVRKQASDQIVAGLRRFAGKKPLTPKRKSVVVVLEDSFSMPVSAGLMVS